jgi:uncharacterized tellurite resistance protein B-like protein
MIDALRQLVRALAGPAGPEPEQVSVELATAVLLVEAMRSDEGSDPQERAAILAALHQRFGVDDGDLHQLLAAAEERSRAANDFFAFTSVLNGVLRQEQKVEVVELMWRIAYTDGSADAGESHVISRVAGLLHVPHGDYIAAKMRAKKARGLS